MLKQLGTTRAALLGVLSAMVAFSYALATSAGVSEKSAGACIRAVGSLTFTNSIVSDKSGTDRDLGLAVAGSSLSRFCRATGGVPPYSFAPAAASDSTALQNAGLRLLSLGHVLGSLSAVLSPFRFGVTVADSRPGSSQKHTETFRITLINSTAFQFANGPGLDDAFRGRFYSTQMLLLNGIAPLNGISISNVTVNGAATANQVIDDAGLVVLGSGTIYGVPVVLGKLEFDASCTDSKGTAARSEDGTTVGQHFVINVTDAPVSSGLLASSIQIRAGAGSGKDSVKYSGQINLGADTLKDLGGTGSGLFLFIGNYGAPDSPAFDSRGKASAKQVRGRAATSAFISSKGQLKITVSKDTISTALLSSQMLVDVYVFLGNGDVIHSAEFLPFDIKVSSRGRTYSYKSGAGLPGGSFLVTSVTGKDDTSKSSPGPSDAWKVGFIAQPVNSGLAATSQSFSSADNAAVTVGAYKMSIGVTPGNKGQLKSNKVNAKTPNAVTKLSMEPNKGKGSLQTSSVLSTNTLIATGSSASKGVAFFLNITLNSSGSTIPSYQGESTMQIYPAKKGWTSNMPK